MTDSLAESKILMEYDGDAGAPHTPRDDDAKAASPTSAADTPAASPAKGGVDKLVPPGTSLSAKLSFKNAAELVKERYLKGMVTKEKARGQALSDKLSRLEQDSHAQIQQLQMDLETAKEDMEAQKHEYEETIIAIRRSAQAAQASGGPAFADKPEVEKKPKKDLKHMIQGQMHITRIKLLESTLQGKEEEIMDLTEKVMNLENERDGLKQELGGAQSGEGKMMNQLQQLRLKNDELMVKNKELEDVASDQRKQLGEIKRQGDTMRDQLRVLKEDYKRAVDKVPPPPVEEFEAEPLCQAYDPPPPERIEVPVEVYVNTEAPPPPPPPPPPPMDDAEAQTEEPWRDPSMDEQKKEVDEKKDVVEQAIKDHEDELSEEKRRQIQEAMEREAQLAAEDEVLELVNNLMKQATAVAKSARMTRMDVFARMEKMVKEMQRRWRRRRLLVIEARKRELVRVLRIMNPFSEGQDEGEDPLSQCTCTCVCDKCSRETPTSSPMKSGDPGPLKYAPITKYSMAHHHPLPRSVLVPRSTYNSIPMYTTGVVPSRLVREVSSAPYSPAAVRMDPRKQGFRLEVAGSDIGRSMRNAPGGAYRALHNRTYCNPTAQHPQGDPHLANNIANLMLASETYQPTTVPHGSSGGHALRQQAVESAMARAQPITQTHNPVQGALHHARLMQRPHKHDAHSPNMLIHAPQDTYLQPTSSNKSHGGGSARGGSDNAPLPNLHGRKIANAAGLRQDRSPTPKTPS
eukprot:TRINITY_DN30241_c0_g1_i1.p1 TRINITY_DN30241_c0_g1~~TRINITY_DN30241_c0_g1_i1.p1  ORF type:complete len:779 (+),score=247.41 TRINITY_DN30241_c0_g1_i1:108-2339(+)